MKKDHTINGLLASIPAFILGGPGVALGAIGIGALLDKAEDIEFKRRKQAWDAEWGPEAQARKREQRIKERESNKQLQLSVVPEIEKILDEQNAGIIYSHGSFAPKNEMMICGYMKCPHDWQGDCCMRSIFFINNPKDSIFKNGAKCFVFTKKYNTHFLESIKINIKSANEKQEPIRFYRVRGVNGKTGELIYQLNQCQWLYTFNEGETFFAGGAYYDGLDSDGFGII